LRRRTKKGIVLDFGLATAFSADEPDISARGVGIAEITSFARLEAGPVKSRPSQAAERQSNQAQHERCCATDYSVACTGTTLGDRQIQPAIEESG
jgi:hypothetical protein